LRIILAKAKNLKA